MAMTWGIWSQLLHYFLCVTSYDLGVFGPYFPKCPYCSITHKRSITEPSDDFDMRLRPHLMLNKELKSLDSFLCFLVHDLGYLGCFPKLPQYPSTWETGITQLTEALDTRVKFHLM